MPAVTRRGGLLALGLALGTVLTACSAGPSTRPPLALVDAAVARGAGAPASSTTPAPPTVPDLQAPVSDLAWTDCTRPTLTRLGLTGGPAGLVLECVTLAVPLDRALPGSTTLGLLRARLPQTPTGSAPLVLLSGPDAPATTTLAQLAVGVLGGSLGIRPVVALDRRGTGTSSPVTCLSATERSALVDLDAGAPDAEATALALGREVSLSCSDVLSPGELAFDGEHAADDVERLRQALGVDTLAVLGSGGGAAVALRDVVRHPARVSRLVLDSPVLPTTDQASAAQDQARGSEAAFDAFSSACVSAGCPVGDPRAAVLALQQQARAQGGLPAAGGRRASAGAVLVAVRQALTAPGTSTAATLGRVLAQARDGDAGGLLALVDAATGRAAQGGDTSRQDGELVATCSDAALRPTAAQVADLVPRWSTENPLFGADAATRLLVCLSWSTPPAAPALAGLDALPPVLVLAAANDPVTGTDAATTAVQELATAGAHATVLRWLGGGHPVLGSSSCTVTAVVGYVSGGALPESGTVCPP
jgi:pimeloyl-ACP methyl ester carboxylesterase